MKKVIALLSSLSVAACAGINVSPSILAFENGVIADVQSICQVEPVAADIALLIPIYGTNIAGAASAICKAVNNAPVAPTMTMTATITGTAVHLVAPPVVVHGVTVHFQ